MDVAHFQVNHGRIAYRWSHGKRENPLVVLHGLGDSAIHTYSPRFASTALKDTSTLLVDLPGFGAGEADAPYPATIERMADDVAMLLRNLQIQSTKIFAHSMGANIALILADKQPNVFSKLVLAEPLFHKEQSVLAARIAKHSEDAFLTRGHHMLLRATSLQAHRGDRAATAFLPVLQLANPVTLHRAAVSLLIDRDPDFFQLLSYSRHRVCLLTGGNSKPPSATVQRLGIRTESVPNAGHFMMAEQAEASACAILNLVN